MNIGSEAITDLFLGEMGIKEACVGDKTVYTREGGYFYLTLDTNEKEN